MRVVIIEDEELAAEKLAAMLHQYDPAIQVTAVLASVETAVAWLQHHPSPDLLLVDIQLSDELCFGIFRQVSVRCPVIFTTAYDQYALRAFQVHSVDYLLKPIGQDKLNQSLDKLRDMRQSFAGAPPAPGDPPALPLDALVQLIRRGNAGYKSRFMVRLGNRIKAVKTDEVAYFLTEQKLSLLVTKENQRYPVDYSLDELTPMLDPAQFFRVNRQLIIHLDAAAEIHPYFKGRLKLILSPPLREEVIVSSERTPAFKAWLEQ
jgi:two-component system LytT family response regulator